MIAVVIERDSEPKRRKIFVSGRPVSIGSDPSNEVVLAHSSVAVFHAVLYIEGRRVTVAAQGKDPVLADGKRVKSTPRAVRKTVTIGEYTLSLVGATALRVEGAPDPVERELLAAIADRDEASRLVYADWLEHRGEVIRAEFLRVQHQLLDLAAGDPQFEPATDRLRELAAHVDLGWRARVARPSIEGCDGFDFQCPKEWGSLAPTDRTDIRFCGACKQHVFYAASVAQAREHAERGECVALDVSSARWPNDLAAPFNIHVCPSCKLDVGPGSTHCPSCNTAMRGRMLRGRMVVSPPAGHGWDD